MSTPSLPVERRWPVLVLGLLLLFQAAGLFGLGSFYLFTLTPGDTAANLPGLLNSSAFNLLAVLALIASFGFLRLHRLGWICAMLLQGLCLLLALSLYIREKSPLAYVLMLYDVSLVLYLNYSDVQTTFQPRSQGRDEA
jgi:hypothetical protein